ncbi:hypothetical protein [Bradyrhizobium macuxiense]|uniref:hypothetical protein n=1 Tax=Bradyrhizobium macuxiense TaxID=1755647 RepID=UPI001365BDEB|nr:hypothetical protein [Bradyrhizobium macuxiense]
MTTEVPGDGFVAGAQLTLEGHEQSQPDRISRCDKSATTNQLRASTCFSKSFLIVTICKSDLNAPELEAGEGS